MEVLPVGEEVQEDEDDREVEPEAGRPDDRHRARGERREQRGGDGARREGPVETAPGEELLRAVERHVGDHEPGDGAEDGSPPRRA